MSGGCPQTNLKKTWVSDAKRQGWGLIPTWVGPQAPCACDPNLPGTCPPFPHVFSSLPGQASAQAVIEADNAASVAASLGLGQGIIYYDMENYDATQCGDAVNAFIDSWANELHLDGYLAGVYGNAGDAGDWWALNARPDNVWIARYDGRATIWGPAHDIPSIDAILDSEWANNQRAHQYIRAATEQWGGVAFSIDNDIEAATVMGAQGTKTASGYSFSAIIDIGAQQTQATGVNDQGRDLHGNSADQIAGAPGFIDDGGLFTQLTCPGGTVSLTAPVAINNLGRAVGKCNLFGRHQHSLCL